MKARDLRTRFAMKAANVADLFGDAFGHVRIAPAAYAPELMTPDGPSTGGGVQAVQHLRLSSPQPGVPPLVMGSLNLKLSIAEIRTFEHIDAIHRARYKRPVPLDQGEYERFIDSLQKYFTAMKVSTTRTVAPLGGLAAMSVLPPPSRAPIVLFLVFLAITLSSASVVYWRLFLHPH